MDTAPVTDDRPREKASTYPVLGAIVADVQLQAGGICLISAERFRHWTKQLASQYPRSKHPKLYQMLCGMSLEFARHRAFAAVQLFALATMGLPAHDAAALAAQDSFLADEVARTDPDALRNKRVLAGPDRPTASGILGPTHQGISPRRGTLKTGVVK